MPAKRVHITQCVPFVGIGETPVQRAIDSRWRLMTGTLDLGLWNVAERIPTMAMFGMLIWVEWQANSEENYLTQRKPTVVLWIRGL